MYTQHSSHRLARVVAVGLTAAALAAPAASARPAAPDAPVVTEPEPAPVVVIDNGFEWDSAAIGAGGAGALLLLVSLGGFSYRVRHHDHINVA
jgi:hypothetical protein